MLGRGGMGVVWRARDETLGEEVALKFLPDAVRWDPAAFDDLKEETRRARKLTHANVVRIHDFVEDASGAAIAMELVEGKTLTELRLARPGKVFDPAEIAPWLPQLAAALDYAHSEARVVHRDLKPSNIMLTHDGRVKVADFGVARSLADSITRVSMMAAGTLVYMSPQQAMGEAPSAADDVYALGATLYELLAGKPPFHTGDVRLQVLQRKPDSIAGRRRAWTAAAGADERAAGKQAGGGTGERAAPAVTALPRGWEETLAACLAKEPEARPASAGELARRLVESLAAEAGGAGRNVSGAGGATHRGWRGRRRWWLGLAAVATAGLWVGSDRVGSSTADGAAAEDGAATAGAAAADASAGKGENAGKAAGFPSDETRALAAWNFDGDGRDAAGRGADGLTPLFLPTEDRFGRIDRALRFNGQNGFQVKEGPELRWGGGQAFTAAIWIKPDRTDEFGGNVWYSGGSAVRSFCWGVGYENGRVTASLMPTHAEQGDFEMVHGSALRAGQWHHVAVVSDGRTVRLYLDGEECATQVLSAATIAAPAPAAAEMWFGQPERISPWSYRGALDDARLWRRALGAEEVRALASRERPKRWVVSTGGYADTDDLGAAITAEFGADARLAEWDTITRMHSHDTRAWLDDVGLVEGGNGVWAQRGGERRFSERRHYLVQRFNGVKPDYYGAHAELGGFALALGSWYAPQSRLLVELPPAAVTTEMLAPGVEGAVRRAWGERERAAAVSLQWRTRLAAGAGTAVRLRGKDGREWRAVCEVGTTRMFAVVLGESGGVERTQQVTPNFGDVDYAVVARDGVLRFRAHSAVGAARVFAEQLAAPGLRLEELAAVEVTGAPGGVRWTVEE